MSEKTCESRKALAIESILARVLRLGSVLAGVLLAAGIGTMLLTRTGFGPGLISAGLIILLLTPVLRVLVAGLVFVHERDWLFALFCLVVLCSLAFGVKLGR
jgi:uncharacterized membrane protein